MKKTLIFTSILILVGVLVACSGIQSAPSAAAAGGPNGAGRPSGTGGQSAGEVKSAEIPLVSKVGIGILKLEDTDQAIDEEKAKELLPLFKALKVLSSDSNTAVDEITGLNLQIKNTMSAEQLAAIEAMKITMPELRTLMESYGVNASASSSTSGTTNSSRNGGGGPGGMPGGGMMGGLIASGNETASTVATPNAVAAMTNSRKSAGGYNLTFVDAIIKLLESKITK